MPILPVTVKLPLTSNLAPGVIVPIPTLPLPRIVILVVAFVPKLKAWLVFVPRIMAPAGDPQQPFSWTDTRPSILAVLTDNLASVTPKRSRMRLQPSGFSRVVVPMPTLPVTVRESLMPNCLSPP